MMFENNNKNVINKISNRSLRINRRRNIFAIIAILLTTLLFTSLFTICLSYLKSFEYSTMRQQGSSSHGGFKNITKKQLRVLSKQSEIEKWGSSLFLGCAHNSKLAKRQVEIRCNDKNFAKFTFITPLIKGRMPKKENEIVVDTIILDSLQLKHRINQPFPLDYDINGKKYHKNS